MHVFFVTYKNRERLAIDRGSKTIVWTMHQYRRMFNCCKIPGLNLDSLKPYFKTGKLINNLYLIY